MVGDLGIIVRLLGLGTAFVFVLFELPDCDVWVSGMDGITWSSCWDGCSLWWLGGLQSRLGLGMNGCSLSLFRHDVVGGFVGSQDVG